MNERIKQLALRANPASKEIYESDSWQFNCAAWSAEDLTKFAELIVGECVEVCRQGKYDSNGMCTNTIQFDSGIRFCMNAIDDHFGVKE